jgi:hypothetical protein
VAFPSDNVLLRLNFEMDLGTTPTEIAEVGFWGGLSGTAPTTNAQWDTLLDALSQEMANAWSTEMPEGNFSPELKLTSCTGVHFDATGKTQNEQQNTPATAWAGTAGPALPWQIAQVVGLYSYTPGTFIANSKQRRGRVYLPGLGVNMMSSSGETAGEGLFDGTKAAANRTAVGAILEDVRALNNGDPGIWVPSVFSRVGSHLWPITDLTTDIKPDTQRRRANRLDVPRLSQAAPWI